MFMAMLAVVYIYNGHTADKLVRNIQRSTRELKDLRNEFKSVKGEALLRSRQSEIRETVRSIGLVELTTEPGILVDSTNESN